jgi:hypothetical protein
MVIWNPILLWLLIHGGDPAPDAKASRLSAALAIRTLATSLGPEARKQIQPVISREIGEAASAL